MKHVYILFFCTVICTQTFFAQEKKLDNAYLKCQYKHSYLKDTLDTVTNDDLFILQIGKNISKCYSYYTFQVDSLNKTPDGKKVWQQLFNKALQEFSKHHDKKRFRNSFPSARSTTVIYKNYPKEKITVTVGLMNDHLLYEDALNAQQWQITNETKTVLGYPCQKAECDFRGRKWTAWFTTDIPISDGPWKFGGLPGLIMEAYDRGKQYNFVIVGLEKVKNEPIIFSRTSSQKGNFKKVKRHECLKAQMRILTNSASMMEMETGVPMGKNKPVYRDLIERDYK